MPLGERRRAMLIAFATAIVLGFLFGWLARSLTSPARESRARNLLEVIRERARDFTRP